MKRHLFIVEVANLYINFPVLKLSEDLYLFNKNVKIDGWIDDIELLISKFGKINYDHLNSNAKFILIKNNDNFDKTIELMKFVGRITGIIFSYWFLKDNCFTVLNGYYISQKDEYFSIHRGIQMYTGSNGKTFESKYNGEDYGLVQPYSSIIFTQAIFQKIPDTNIITIHPEDFYDNMSRIQRATFILITCRNNDILPFKIANYISTLECLLHSPAKSKKLQARSKFIINNENFDVDDTICNIVHEGYLIRSDFFHGNKIRASHENNSMSILSSKLDRIVREIFTLAISSYIENNNDEKPFDELVKSIR